MILHCELPTPPLLSHASAFAAGHAEVAPSSAPGLHFASPARHIPKRNFGRALDPAEQQSGAPSSEFNLIYHVLGVGNGFPNFTVGAQAPNTNLAVGDTEVVQWVDVSYADFDKNTGAIDSLLSSLYAKKDSTDSHRCAQVRRALVRN